MLLPVIGHKEASFSSFASNVLNEVRGNQKEDKKMGVQKKGKTILGFICIVSMLTLAACSSTGGKPQAGGETGQAPASSNNKTISIGIISPPFNFNPISLRGPPTIYLQR